MSSFNENVIAEFRANEGRVGGPFEGVPLLLLTTTGRRSGKPRTLPLGTITDGDSFVIAASDSGGDKHPLWLANLEADPRATIEVGTRTIEVRARIEASGPERDRLYAALVKEMSPFADYEAKTTRLIPVVVLKETAAENA
ncbi:MULTISPECIES: nitroreductase family deazaflavin-dependent oxidoreductase [Actinoalloteichus]|uniref:Deazaflavin-dependent oxidoreductase, nitroreductase family n=1 Tax=Actinoalloteichus fjordicus TaxID=1612552 RepID=A0AAC9PS81_9PSEU|nr:MULTISPECIES: nitroreductase family deazaflavin-dependent oxidoreductase [Actinoalloteichus]APU14750.1 deazaflavin-dependent oxidoreductase, nitroreductase family [Actinoalloteichus fjordicus]APU20719.1 deazaflavin-dependent oxidoreductase, nitroreductase family [Actinoalloteichus sp. GBA129-24]